MPKGKASPPGSLTNISQVWISPIPAQTGQPHRYTNIGSFGWAVNRFSVTDPEVIANARSFIELVSDEQFQILAAETLGQVPSLMTRLGEGDQPGSGAGLSSGPLARRTW